MKTAAAIDPQRSTGQTWHIAVGEHVGGLADPNCLACQVHVIIGGPNVGRIELDIREIEERRILMSELEAESLAHVFRRMKGDDGGLRIAHALLDAAHMARQLMGQKSVRTQIDALK